MDQALLMPLAMRLADTRAEILKRQPFFGRLLLRMNFCFEDCQTAYTDMHRIVFDPEFGTRLSLQEMEFVLLHELMHCVLRHCVRGGGRMHLAYNIACDIVVNSMLLEAIGKKEMKIQGSLVPHRTPDGEEGRLYSAEEVYEMLIKRSLEDLERMQQECSFDHHGCWEPLFEDPILGELWNGYVKEAARAAGFTGQCPAGLERIVGRITRAPRLDWRQVLRDHLQRDRYDYDFHYPDKRFFGEVVLPSYRINEEFGRVEQLWFAVDTSGSVSDEALSLVLSELEGAMEQMGEIRGSISFFDLNVTPPHPFETKEELLAAKPKGYGGTSFRAVFQAMERYFKEELPKVVVILTDGYDTFPPKEAARGVDVIWIIVGSDVVPPWGTRIQLDMETEGRE